jgi:ABC-type dipeptide/oligopeptide/nickel transport system permease subunit
MVAIGIVFIGLLAIAREHPVLREKEFVEAAGAGAGSVYIAAGVILPNTRR